MSLIYSEQAAALLQRYAELRQEYLHVPVPETLHDIESMKATDLMLWAECEGLRRAAEILLNPTAVPIGLPVQHWTGFTEFAAETLAGQKADYNYRVTWTTDSLFSDERRDSHSVDFMKKSDFQQHIDTLRMAQLLDISDVQDIKTYYRKVITEAWQEGTHD